MQSLHKEERMPTVYRYRVAQRPAPMFMEDREGAWVRAEDYNRLHRKALGALKCGCDHCKDALEHELYSFDAPIIHVPEKEE